MKLMFEIERRMYIPHGVMLYLGEKAREYAATGYDEALISVHRMGTKLAGDVLITDGPRYAALFNDETGLLVETLINRGPIGASDGIENDPED